MKQWNEVKESSEKSNKFIEIAKGGFTSRDFQGAEIKGFTSLQGKHLLLSEGFLGLAVLWICAFNIKSILYILLSHQSKSAVVNMNDGLK